MNTVLESVAAVAALAIMLSFRLLPFVLAVVTVKSCS